MRTGASLSYADGGDFITLNTVQDIQTSASPTFVGLDLTGTLTVDTINEHTGAAGVTIEGILIKDSDVNLQDYDAVIFGDGQDAYIYFDETRLLINSVSEVWIGVEYDKPLVAGNLFSNGNMNIGYIAMRHNWKSYLDVLEIGGTGALFCNTSVIAGMEIGISQNAYFDETDERWEYAVADEASVYIQNVGRHLFYVNDGAGAGVGGAISWSCGLIIAKDATVTCEGASVTIGKTDTTTGSLILHDSNSANTITITAPDISAGSLVFTLPATDGDNTNVLQTDGNGVLSWTAVNAFSAYTNLDSESNVLLKSHAYQAATDGFVDAFVTTSGVGQAINIYVGSTDNPAGEGTLIQRHAQDTTGNVLNVSARVAKDEYFEVTTTSTNAVTINWKSIGTLSNPIDQD